MGICEYFSKYPLILQNLEQWCYIYIQQSAGAGDPLKAQF